MSAPHRAKIAVAVSGGGRSLANFLARQAEPAMRYEVGAVIASRPDCKAVMIANDHRLPLFVGNFAPAQRAHTATELVSWLESHGIAWVALAGFLKIYPVTRGWEGRVVNIHPALLPAFGGKGMYGDRVHDAVIGAAARESGATVHFVNDHYDEGAAIAQIVVPVHPGDDAHTLADRVFAAECRLYPDVMSRLIGGELPRSGGLVERTVHDR